MAGSSLGILFQRISKQWPSRFSIEELRKYPDQEELSQFLLAKMKTLLENSNADGPNESSLEWGVIHSVRLMRGLWTEESLDVALALLDLVAEDPLSALHDALMVGLEGAGQVGLEPAYARFQEDLDNPEIASVWLWVLACLGVKDKRIYSALLEHFHNDLGEAVHLMAEYDDKRFIPLVEGYVKCLAEYLNENKIDALAYGARLDDPFVNDYIEARDALVVLKEGKEAVDGNFDLYDEKLEALDRKLLKFSDMQAHKRGLKELQSELLKVKTGRNDPCPCGSGKKYKHCCGKA